MAIRERKDRAKPWQVYWKNPFTGKRESKSFAAKEEALKEDSLVKHRMKFEREWFRPAAAPEVPIEREEPKELTLEQVYFLYLKEKQFNKKGIETQILAMRVPLSLYGGCIISSIGKNEIKNIVAALGEAPIKQSTRRRRLSVLRAFLNWCAEKEYCEKPLFPKIPCGHYEKYVPPTPEELRLMLAAAPPHIQRVIIFGSQFGIRIGTSELFKLSWNDIDLSLAIIRVKAAQKNPLAPWREVPIRKSLLEIMRAWRAEDAAAGIERVIHFQGKPVSCIRTAWANTLKHAGITRWIRPYDLRHAFATELIAQGVDIGTIAKLMGHSSPAMIYQHYQFVLDKQKLAAVESLPDLAHVPKKMCPNTKGAAPVTQPLEIIGGQYKT